MANDSPAKSLVDIDLASLRVSVLHSDIFTLAFTLFLPLFFFNKKNTITQRGSAVVDTALRQLFFVYIRWHEKRTGRSRLLHRTNPLVIATGNQLIRFCCLSFSFKSRILLGFSSWWKWSEMVHMDKSTRLV